MKSLMRKTVADKLLRRLGVHPSELVCDEAGKTMYHKGTASITYISQRYGSPALLVVTCDIAVRDIAHAYGIVLHEYDQPHTVDRWEFSSAEVHSIRHGGHDLPVYVLVLEGLTQIPPGHELHGVLKSECSYAMQLWADLVQDRVQHSGQMEVGTFLSQAAEVFWGQVRALTTLKHLHDLADFCLSAEAGYYYPALSASNFAVDSVGRVVPLGAVTSLVVWAAVLGIDELYTGEN